MRTAKARTETEQVRRLPENLKSQLAKGGEWATPGVQAALQRAVAGLDTGIETASPRLQALLRRLADELAGSVETLTPRVHEQLMRVGPRAAAPVPIQTRKSPSRIWWLLTGIACAGAGAAVWQFRKASKPEPSPWVNTEELKANRADTNVDADLTSGRM
ncbi:hypothetical protein SAMN04489743_2112 [Pseudarthrobacter equi]|uniref:Uncharacterized protein n=1 Tax=Pseudarthrobacter equi TaxID=728066 RepID=A0A1H1YQ74_9MICC|nr:hypothetical protein [Pseudarthrobacter equi]SDT23608.1 hypothetical protein SAMN04489743_2112 [Pseudarthrobacter equi]